MILLRLFVIAFNVAVVTYLVYRMLQVARTPMVRARKIIILGTGVFLLLVPFAMFLKIMLPSMQYFLLYPVAVSLFLYLLRHE
jgi:hypothetical protein